MEYILTVAFASAFILALFLIVAKTIGQFGVVKRSPTLNDITDFLNPGSSETKAGNKNAQARTEEQYAVLAENLSETVRTEADAGKKLEAVKLHMNESGETLMEAKKIVEAYLRHSAHKG